MQQKEREEFGVLYARLEDLCLRAEHGEAAMTDFLSPREQHYAQRYLTRKGAIACCAYGGYAEAERRRLYLLPEYMLSDDASEALEQIDLPRVLAEFGYGTEVTLLRIEGSGYRNLTHRDYLGSLLALGLERSVLGDIVLDGDAGRCAVLFCESLIADFIVRALERVANDKVKVTPMAQGDFVPPVRQFLPIRDTVASPRLDCVVAALCGLSREKARSAVCGGLVELNFESEERPDRTVIPPALISVRGFGRYRVTALADRTRKGRYRLEAEQYR